jgi:coiled-coil domain-containing protein 55
MNINLKSGASSGKKSIGFGLNPRGKKNGNSNGKKSKKKSVFDADDDSSSSASDPEDANNNNDKIGMSSKAHFNRELAAEQAALRARAEKAMQKEKDHTVYDYDAEYESFSAGHAHEQTTSQNKNENDPDSSTTNKKEKKESKYIQNLLQKAKERQFEREIVMERKIAKEQKEEEADLELKGKDKFVTKSYKRKLEERAEWVKAEEDRVKQDADDDVTKKVGGSAMMGFYSNLSRIGGDGASSSTGGNVTASKERNQSERKESTEPTDRVEEEWSSNSPKDTTSSSRRRYQRNIRQEHVEEVEMQQELAIQKKRIERMQKVFKARDRYLERKRIMAQREDETKSQ